jgi:hypothetical protein
MALTAIGPSIIAARALTTSNFRRLSNTVEAGMLVGTMIAIGRALTSPAANFLLASALSGLWLQERVSVTNFARLSPVRPEVSANAPCWHAISTRSSAFPGARSGGESQGRRIRRYTPMPSAVSPHAKTSIGRRVFFAFSPSPTWDERARDSRARRIAIVRTANPSLVGTRPSS